MVWYPWHFPLYYFGHIDVKALLMIKIQPHTHTHTQILE